MNSKKCWSKAEIFQGNFRVNVEKFWNIFVNFTEISETFWWILYQDVFYSGLYWTNSYYRPNVVKNVTSTYGLTSKLKGLRQGYFQDLKREKIWKEIITFCKLFSIYFLKNNLRVVILQIIYILIFINLCSCGDTSQKLLLIPYISNSFLDFQSWECLYRSPFNFVVKPYVLTTFFATFDL